MEPTQWLVQTFSCRRLATLDLGPKFALKLRNVVRREPLLPSGLQLVGFLQPSLINCYCVCPRTFVHFVCGQHVYSLLFPGPMLTRM